MLARAAPGLSRQRWPLLFSTFIVEPFFVSLWAFPTNTGDASTFFGSTAMETLSVIYPHSAREGVYPRWEDDAFRRLPQQPKATSAGASFANAPLTERSPI